MPVNDDRPIDSEDYELLLPPDQRENGAAADANMGQEEQLIKNEERRGDMLAFYAAMTASAVSLVITLIVVLSNHPTQVGWFAWHPVMQALAMTLFTYGILTLQPTSQPKTKAAGLTRHQIAMFCTAFPVVAFGTFAVVYNKFIRDKHHFKSWHGTIGIACMAWIAIQVAIGGASVWFGGAAFGGGMKAKLVWRYHRISGYVLFVFLLLTVILGGGWSGWGEKYVSYPARFLAYTLSPLVVLVAVGVRARLSKMNIF
ncbi:hypothetical protein CPB85DRAFT_817591 [Mucidula mucida]|nr:hypothetical protein CPB85DRAFT_817591 [Mucidula mucida]